MTNYNLKENARLSTLFQCGGFFKSQESTAMFGVQDQGIQPTPTEAALYTIEILCNTVSAMMRFGIN